MGAFNTESFEDFVGVDTSRELSIDAQKFDELGGVSSIRMPRPGVEH
ncbi:hypothetical protein [Arthrobacter sp. MMS18-M83]|nr:hypothetical protein [Arthrobacter sp. MMS18-M83]WAH97530.1 hypothetical protein OW521_01100 [Arthrobacter sp. MMS18-M83]